MDTTKKALAKVCSAISDKKGDEIVVLDVRKISSFTDYFVICSGNNRKQNQAISDAVAEALKKEHQSKPAHTEGYDTAEWILLDYIDFVVHIFSQQSRQFYKLEKLWSDGVELAPQALTA